MSHEEITPVPTPELTGKAKGLANLRPAWPKGVSGNPNGRPKEIIRPLIRALMHAPAADLEALELEEHLPVGKAVALRLVKQSLAKGAKPLHNLVTLVDGPQPRELVGAGGAPLIPDVLSGLEEIQALIVFARERAKPK